MIATDPDLCHVVFRLSQYMESRTNRLRVAVKRTSERYKVQSYTVQIMGSTPQHVNWLDSVMWTTTDVLLVACLPVATYL